ncbi:MAG: exodeoxyribonuclease III [Deltaproteobacteria bacterium]|nr:exodeoxyribonuclease III [Deltaproteobacteria bacterium]MBW2070872.1 exodeoxyribonuclease III [Deltaproteobacteria bacterium]
MKVASWNVNSIRVRLPAVLEWLAAEQPDVLCLQEIKVPDELFPGEVFRERGYEVAVSGQKTYNGVAIISRYPLVDVLPGFPDYEAEGQKRLLAATVGKVRLLNTYIPNGAEPASPKFIYKLEFIAELRRYLERLHSPADHLLLVGDFNIAPEERDVYDAQAMEGQIGFHPKERAALTELKNWGLEDVFRRHHKERGHYSWWDYRANAFRRNMGLRIDHIWATAPMAALSRECGMVKELRARPRPSDHIPVWATFAYEPERD